MTEQAHSIPEFKTEAEEREFWDSHDATDVVASDQWEQSGARRRPTTTFAIRLEHSDVEKIRVLARSRGIGPTQLARAWLLDRIRLEQAVGELANPEADEEELQIRRKVMEDVANGIPPIVAGALLAFGVGTAVGEAISKKKRASTRSQAASAARAQQARQGTGSERKAARG